MHETMTNIDKINVITNKMTREEVGIGGMLLSYKVQILGQKGQSNPTSIWRGCGRRKGGAEEDAGGLREPG